MTSAARFGLAALLSALAAVGVWAYLKHDQKPAVPAAVASAPAATTGSTAVPPASPTASPTPAVAAAPPAAFKLESATGSDQPVELTNTNLSVKLDPYGAGVASITLPEFHPGKNDQTLYVLSHAPADQTGHSLINGYGAVDITVDGTKVQLFNGLWATTARDAASVTFSATILDQQGRPAVRVERTWHLATDAYGLELKQKIVNLDGMTHEISFQQMAQNDVSNDGASYMGDRRKFALGYFSAQKDPAHKAVETKDGFIEREKIVSKMEHAEAYRDADFKSLWPWYDIESPLQRDEARRNGAKQNTELAWLGSYNRYFLLVTHTPVPADAADASGLVSLESLFPAVHTLVKRSAPEGNEKADQSHAILLTLETGKFELKTKDESKDLSLAIYAGPRDSNPLSTVATYKTLGLDQTIRYRLTEGFCGMFAFQWLAHILMAVLTFLRTHVTLDWGAAIIMLVLAVRLCLHPLTKKSQVSMMRFGKQIQSIQPELEKVKAKYPGDKEKLSQETMRLYKEKGINPANALGCLPMFLQMPIWSALYAMLYYAFPLRHQAAFWGFFQKIPGLPNWQFLGDLSSSDRFIALFPDDGHHIFKLIFVQFDYSSINLLPILMTVVMYFNMKYTQTPAATDEQKTQQNIMKIMTLGMFPLMLYSAPCGLTLYITASTMAGIIDSMIVRRHVKALEAAGTLLTKAPKAEPKPGSWRYKLSQRMAYAKAVAEAKRDGGPMPLNPKQQEELEKLKKQNPFPRGPQSRWGK